MLSITVQKVGGHMSRILLTKSPISEVNFEMQVEQLGHEVFSSMQLLQLCLQDELSLDFLSIFHQIVLSETIDNLEAARLMNKLKKYPLIVLRKTNELLAEKQAQQLKQEGFSDYIANQMSLEAIREALSCWEKREEGLFFTLPKRNTKHDLSSLDLNNREMKLLRVLYEQGDTAISRDELCLVILHKESCNSTMSQLSALVKRLRSKLAEQGVKGQIIETLWGQGYKLHASVFDQVYLDNADAVI